MSSQKFPQGTITFGATEELDDEKKLEQEVETLTPPAADDNEISQIHGAMAGIASGYIFVRCRAYGCSRYNNRCCSKSRTAI